MIRCSEFMTHPVQYCAPDESVREVVEIMRAADVGCVPVANYETKLLLGMITDRGLVLKVVGEGRNPNEAKAGEVMSHAGMACTPDTSLDEVIRTMDEHQLHRIPVVDQDNRLVGIISLGDIANRIPRQAVDLLVSVLGPKRVARAS